MRWSGLATARLTSAGMIVGLIMTPWRSILNGISPGFWIVGRRRRRSLVVAVVVILRRLLVPGIVLRWVFTAGPVVSCRVVMIV